jgi:hypothetical protein
MALALIGSTMPWTLWSVQRRSAEAAAFEVEIDEKEADHQLAGPEAQLPHGDSNTRGYVMNTGPRVPHVNAAEKDSNAG